MDKLVIVMTTDKNYIIPTKIAIYSMAKSNRDVLLDIHILCNRQLDEKSRSDLWELKSKLNHVHISFDEVCDETLAGAKTLGYVPVASYYRLFISKLIEDDRCLFVDGDIVINADLKDIYNTEMKDYYIAGVRDCAVQSKNDTFTNHEIDLELPDMHHYVNAGFMLFNLKKIRKDKLDDVFISAIGDGYRYMDQDILNKFCYGKIKHLPLRYNLFAEFYGRIDKMGETDFSKEEIMEAENWAVLHYPGRYKPWMCSRLKANQIWWKLAAEILTKEEYTTCSNRAKEYERISDWTYICEKIGAYKDIVIFGFSKIGCELETQLKKAIPGISITFADNDITKQGSIHDGKTILSAEAAVRECIQSFWIISSQMAYVPIKKQLVEMGIEEDHIVRYIYKTDAYYEGLDEENYKYEMKILESS